MLRSCVQMKCSIDKRWIPCVFDTKIINFFSYELYLILMTMWWATIRVKKVYCHGYEYSHPEIYSQF